MRIHIQSSVQYAVFMYLAQVSPRKLGVDHETATRKRGIKAVGMEEIYEVGGW